MDDLNKALGDISRIRRQVARATEFRGYGPATLGATGVLAVLGACSQATWLPHPAEHVGAYLAIWITTALVSASLIAIQTVTRAHRVHSGMADEMIHMAVEQFLPAAGAGALLTLVIACSVPSSIWMLPGLWQVTFSLGVFSSCRFLPRPMVAAGAWYLLAGLTCITLGDGRALSPWTMGLAYGGGQLLVAAILLFTSAKEPDEV
jgi:fumarate reductase subunit D